MTPFGSGGAPAVTGTGNQAPRFVDPQQKQPIPPAELGLCPERLGRLADSLSRDVDEGRIPGAVVLVARYGHIAFFEAFGLADPDTLTPMAKDSIFRLASLTKPFTSAAAMSLVERGELVLGNPLSEYIPEFSGLRSLSQGQAHQEATIQDLLRHTAGFTYGEFGTTSVHEGYRRLDVLDPMQSSKDMVEKLAKIPLAYPPATTFEYGMSTDVLGHVMERRRSQSLELVLQNLIAAPLGLHDTSFLLQDHFRGRLAQASRDPATGERPWMASYHNTIAPPSWCSGGGGLLSTAHDYYSFLQSLLDDLLESRGRLLASKTVAWMTSDHLPRHVAFGEYMPTLGLMSPMPDRGQGFGLGFLVRLETGRNTVPGSVGDFSWAGISGTYAWVDPLEHLVVVFMMQAPGARDRYRSLTRQFVYQALKTKTVDPRGEYQ